jgi:hypothetical protein
MREMHIVLMVHQGVHSLYAGSSLNCALCMVDAANQYKVEAKRFAFIINRN